MSDEYIYAEEWLREQLEQTGTLTVEIIITNGAHITGAEVLTVGGDFLLIQVDGKRQMIMRSAISTIIL